MGTNVCIRNSAVNDSRINGFHSASAAHHVSHNLPIPRKGFMSASQRNVIVQSTTNKKKGVVLCRRRSPLRFFFSATHNVRECTGTEICSALNFFISHESVFHKIRPKENPVIYISQALLNMVRRGEGGGGKGVGGRNWM